MLKEQGGYKVILKNIVQKVTKKVILGHHSIKEIIVRDRLKTLANLAYSLAENDTMKILIGSFKNVMF